MYKEWLMGTWFLESFKATDEDGDEIDILGEGATGFICYSQDGWMSVAMTSKDRMRYDIPDVEGGSDLQTLSAARGYFTYAGKYTVDEENSLVFHNLEYSLIPNWVGSKQKRYITKESDNVLVLSGDPVKIGPGGKKRVSRLRWVRGQ